METVSANTKRQVNGGVETCKEEELTLTTATKRNRTEEDDEVEAFFAILRRVRHWGRLYGGKANGDGDGKESTWKPVFEWEDFAVGDVRDDGTRRKKDEVVEEKRTGAVLDLNAEPQPEPEES